MPGPLASDLHVDSLLTPVLVGFSNPMYIHRDVFPNVDVKKQSDIIPKFDQSPWFRNAAKFRARGAPSTGGGFSVNTTDTYYCRMASFRDEIAWEDRANADDSWDLDRSAAEFVADKIEMLKEVQIATDFFKAGVWGTDKTGGTDFTVWSDYGGSQPLVDMADWQDTIEGLVGREAAVLVLGKQAWTKLRWHPDLLDLIKHTQIPDIQPGRVAEFGGFQKVLIGRAIYTTAVEGTAEASVTYSRIWGKHALLMYVPPRATMRTPAAGYTFTWNIVPNAMGWIERMTSRERRVDIIEGNTYFDQKLVVKNAALFASGVVA